MTAVTGHLSQARSSAASSFRLPVIDVARGAAIVAMVIYHSAWDITFFGLAPIDAVNSPFWRNFAHVIAASFLTIVGVSLALANGGVRTPGQLPRDWRWQPFARRLAIIVAAAAVVTLGTWVATPASFIYFGILHCIAAASLLALPFVWLPAIVPAALGAAIVALPFVYRSAAFDVPWLAWVGLGHIVPDTSDYVPIFPWAGAVFLGVAIAQLGLPALAAGALGRWRPRMALARGLAWAGRHSLPIYLLHQLILMALFWSLFQLAGPNTTALAMRIREDCVATCASGDDDRAQCRLVCACTVRALRHDRLIHAYASGRITDEQRPRLSAAVRQCRAAEPPQLGGK